MEKGFVACTENGADDGNGPVVAMVVVLDDCDDTMLLFDAPKLNGPVGAGLTLLELLLPNDDGAAVLLSNGATVGATVVLPNNGAAGIGAVVPLLGGPASCDMTIGIDGAVVLLDDPNTKVPT